MSEEVDDLNLVLNLSLEFFYGNLGKDCLSSKFNWSVCSYFV